MAAVITVTLCVVAAIMLVRCLHGELTNIEAVLLIAYVLYRLFA